MQPPTIRELISEALGPWLPPLFDQPLPRERRATCESCAMCKSSDTQPSGSPHGFLNPDTKCCTYHPSLPNFSVGALLEDHRPELAEGQRRMRNRIQQQHGVAPHGVSGAPLYWMKYDRAREAFGHSPHMLCPFYDAGRCSIWQWREGTCSTYFCKHDRGEEARVFYTALRDYMAQLGRALALHAMLELGVEPGRAMGKRSPHGVTPEELDGAPLPEKEYHARWGSYAGREEEFFRHAAAVVRDVSSKQASALGGSLVRAHLLRVQNAYERMTNPRVPERLRRNPVLRVLPDHEGSYLLEGYSSMDASRVAKKLYDVLDSFDGRPNEQVVQALKSEGRPFPSDGLVRSLYHHRVLVDADELPLDPIRQKP